jgi:lysozyme
MNSLIKRFIAIGAPTVIAVTGAVLIDPWESNKNHAYIDMVGIATICRGETKGVKLGDYRTDEQCDKSTVEELELYNKAMKRHVKVELKPYEEIAYTSFVWNIGETGFKNSTLLKKLNLGDSLEACKEILNWNKATFSVRGAQTQLRNGEKCTTKQNGDMSCTVKGLTNRRTQEYRVCIGEDKAVNEALHALNLDQKSLETLEIRSEGIDEVEAEKALLEPLNEEQEVVKDSHEVPITQEVPQQVVCSFKIFGICFQKRQ